MINGVSKTNFGNGLNATTSASVAINKPYTSSVQEGDSYTSSGSEKKKGMSPLAKAGIAIGVAVAALFGIKKAGQMESIQKILKGALEDGTNVLKKGSSLKEKAAYYLNKASNKIGEFTGKITSKVKSVFKKSADSAKAADAAKDANATKAANDAKVSA